ncbi:MAG: 3,4-dihydroxy-2-butanone-4-phosphate synthase [Buchnera aphidicola (Eriosoma harunire)]
MKKKLLSIFGTSKQRVLNAIQAIKKGEGIILLDDEKRENEGDLIFSAEKMTVKQMALTIRYGSGIVCLCITEPLRKKLNLPMMVKHNTNKYQTPFTVTIEASTGISTGVSAQDRITTIKTAISDQFKTGDLHSPGHVFPLCAHPKGIIGRAGHTEATIELIKLAGLKSIGVLCELTNYDGSMARITESIQFAQIYNMKILTIPDLIEYMTL